MTSRQVGSYEGPATLIDVVRGRRLDGDVHLTSRQETLTAGNQEIPGLISWGGSVRSSVHLGEWLGTTTRIELPNGCSGTVLFSRVDGMHGTLRGSGRSAIRRGLTRGGPRCACRDPIESSAKGASA